MYQDAAAGAVSDAGMPETAPALGGKETVLVVEDQAEVRECAVTVLEEDSQFIRKPLNPGRLTTRVREVPGPPKRPARIPVAGGEAGVRGFLRTALEEGGYEVIEAEDGKQALKQVRAGGVDLVITDIVMPEQEGIETIQALRKEIPGIGIIAISGKFEAPYLKMAGMLGTGAMLAKPVAAQLLLARVAEVLKSRR